MRCARARVAVVLSIASASLCLGLVADTVTVKHTQLDVRKTRSLMSPPVFTARQGDVLNVTERGADGWDAVSPASDASKSGYVRDLQINDAKLAIAAASPPSATPLSGSRDATASAAAKGIGADAAHLAVNKHYDVAPVNRMIDTRSAIAPGDVKQFRKEGGLH